MAEKNVTIKSGLEIHQQLDTHKLFCHCPSVLRNDEPAFEVRRKLHAVAGESGEVDKAAQHEASRDKEFSYQVYDTTCLVELDEEPPHVINEEALQIALHVSLLLHCEILPITQIMRKTVIDGSNTSGFQRTVLIARNGWVDTPHGKVRIENVSLEEDAARIVDDKNNTKTFRLDRLGIPLIEIGTYPDITSAEQCKEVALFIGDVLRSCKVKRGIGTIRQDINISIPGHDRVEIKGFQDVKMFTAVIAKETERQKKNITEKKIQSEVRNALMSGETEFLRPMPGAARMYPETDLPLLKISRDILNEAKKTLPQLRSEKKKELVKKGLTEDEARILLGEDLLEEFEAFLKIISEPKLVYKMLIELPKEIAAREKKSTEEVKDLLTLDILESILDAVQKGRIARVDIKQTMEKIAHGKKFEEAIRIEKADLGDVEGEIAKLVKDKPGLSIGGYMGLVMEKFKGKINGKDASEILKKLLS
ncbi:MAG: hypothetical protein RL557_887 [archaeon]|jgi:Glu-tRNA(Gln) amidotransferase subunit E-like FAD-binding protein